jgi:hypothetical protein
VRTGSKGWPEVGAGAKTGIFSQPKLKSHVMIGQIKTEEACTTVVEFVTLESRAYFPHSLVRHYSSAADTDDGAHANSPQRNDLFYSKQSYPRCQGASIEFLKGQKLRRIHVVIH